MTEKQIRRWAQQMEVKAYMDFDTRKPLFEKQMREDMAARQWFGLSGSEYPGALNPLQAVLESWHARIQWQSRLDAIRTRTLAHIAQGAAREAVALRKWVDMRYPPYLLQQIPQGDGVNDILSALLGSAGRGAGDYDL